MPGRGSECRQAESRTHARQGGECCGTRRVARRTDTGSARSAVPSKWTRVGATGPCTPESHDRRRPHSRKPGIGAARRRPGSTSAQTESGQRSAATLIAIEAIPRVGSGSVSRSLRSHRMGPSRSVHFTRAGVDGQRQSSGVFRRWNVCHRLHRGEHRIWGWSRRWFCLREDRRTVGVAPSVCWVDLVAPEPDPEARALA